MIHWNLCREAFTGHLEKCLYSSVLILSCSYEICPYLGILVEQEDYGVRSRTRASQAMAMLPTPRSFDEAASSAHCVITGSR